MSCEQNNRDDNFKLYISGWLMPTIRVPAQNSLPDLFESSK